MKRDYCCREKYARWDSYSIEFFRNIKNDKRCGFGIANGNHIDRVGVHGVINRIKARIGDGKVYVSVDIDVLDPAYAPAT